MLNLSDDDYNTGALAIALIKGTDYPEHLENRRDKHISRYIPFNEFEDIDSNIEINERNIIKLFQSYSLIYKIISSLSNKIFFYLNRKTT